MPYAFLRIRTVTVPVYMDFMRVFIKYLFFNIYGELKRKII